MALSYCAQAVRDYDRDRFLASLFVPARGREALLVILALGVELAHVREAVSEEMIGHIRYAWWQEAIEGAYDTGATRGHPLIEALLPLTPHLPKEQLLALVDAYRAAFPEAPADVEAVMKILALDILQGFSVDDAGWRKANALIQKHRARFGKGWNGWLALKLLAAGLT